MNIDAHIANHKSGPYSHLLVFVREFTGGTLAGLTHEDSIPFTTDGDARSWTDAINAKAKRGKINYRVIESVVVSL